MTTVSVILVNYKGADDVIECLGHFDDVDWPSENLELIVVDNDSQDGSFDKIREACPQAKVYESGRNAGFAGGCNFGVEKATGEIIAFINSDARPHRDWIREAVAVLDADETVGAVASKVLDWEGNHIDYVDGALSWFGMGYKREVTRVDNGDYDQAKDVLFGTGAAMFVRADLYRALGGFDERFFMFFEDVDFGWRMNLLGHRFRYVPTSLAYHRHHVAIKKFGEYRELFLLERNALMSLYKNLDDASLARALPAAMMMAVSRSDARGDEQRRKEREQGMPDNPVGTHHKVRLTGPYAVEAFRAELPSLEASRAEIQGARVNTDAEVFPLFRQPMNPLVALPEYLADHDALTEVLGINDHFHQANRVLVVTGDVISEKMAGPAIRAWEMSTALAKHCETRLVSTTNSKLTEGPGFAVHTAAGPALLEHVEWADVLVFQGYLLWENPWIVELDLIIVADIYDPFHLEQLEQARDLGEEGRTATVESATYVLNDQIRRADLMLCASDKQRAFWIGQAEMMGRSNLPNAHSYGDVANMIKVVPFGLGDEPPVQRKHGIRGTVPGIGKDDKVILWGGGVYNWFDPLTLVRAVDRLSKRHPDVRLFFLGLKHPNPAVPEMRVAWELRELSDALGLTGKFVFFNSGWVPYNERADWLMDADVGVSTHYEHIETAYSFRTRILDYLWAGLPIVATTGDSFGNVLDSEGIGIGVPPEDVDALEAALEKMLYDEDAHAAAKAEVARFAEGFRWNRVLAPLIDFCVNPMVAPDLDLRKGAKVRSLEGRPEQLPSTLRRDLQLFKDYLAAGGPKLVAQKVSGRLKKVLTRNVASD